MIQIQQLSQRHSSQCRDVAANSRVISAEVEWFQTVLTTRFQYYFEKDQPISVDAIPAPDLTGSDAVYSRFIRENGFGPAERLCLILAMLPHIKPEVLDTFFIKNKHLEQNYTEFGGWKGKSHAGFLPTAETFMFVLAGGEMQERFNALAMFDDDAPLIKFKVVSIDNEHTDEPFLSGALRISNEYLNGFTTGIIHQPDFSARFPAKRLTTHLDWDDLVLAPKVREEVNQVLAWTEHHETIMASWMAKNIKPGYRVLLYGPPGTGKSLTAALIGKHTGIDVYRIDLSALVSKYIGETEKNLANVFDQAESKNWILFFDEADALFGQRTTTNSSHDRYANQEVSYLLQRIEDYPGIIILASNLKQNIDKAFARRFQSIIYYPLPEHAERESLWRGMLGEDIIRQGKIDVCQLARECELSGGAMTNALRQAALLALRDNNPTINHQLIVECAHKEMRKEGKAI